MRSRRMMLDRDPLNLREGDVPALLWEIARQLSFINARQDEQWEYDQKRDAHEDESRAQRDALLERMNGTVVDMGTRIGPPIFPPMPAALPDQHGSQAAGVDQQKEGAQ